MILLFLIRLLKTSGKIIAAFVALLAAGKEAIAQGISYRVSNPNHTGEWYNNANNKVVGRFNDSLKLELMPPSIVFSGMAATPDDGNPTGSMMWSDALGNVKHTLMSNITVPISTVLGLGDTLNSRLRTAAFAALFTASLTAGSIGTALGYTPANYATTITINGSTQDLSTSRTWSVGTLLPNDTVSLSNRINTKFNAPTGTTGQYLRGDGTVATFPTIPTNNNQLTNGAGYITGNQTITLSGDATGSGTTAIAVTLSNTAVTPGQYNGPYTVDSKGRVTSAANQSFNNSPSVTIQTVAAAANGNQLSTTRSAQVSYSITVVSTATISGGAVGYCVLEICPTNSSTAGDWIEVARSPNGQAVSLALTLQSVSTGGGCMAAIVPAGYYRRVRSVNSSGTQTFTFNSGQEVLL